MIPVQMDTAIGIPRTVPVESRAGFVVDRLAILVTVAIINTFGVSVGENPTGLDDWQGNDKGGECDRERKFHRFLDEIDERWLT
jgi:hypothetical protein